MLPHGVELLSRGSSHEWPLVGTTDHGNGKRYLTWDPPRQRIDTKGGQGWLSLLGEVAIRLIWDHISENQVRVQEVDRVGPESQNQGYPRQHLPQPNTN